MIVTPNSKILTKIKICNYNSKSERKQRPKMLNCIFTLPKYGSKNCYIYTHTTLIHFLGMMTPEVLYYSSTANMVVTLKYFGLVTTNE